MGDKPMASSKDVETGHWTSPVSLRTVNALPRKVNDAHSLPEAREGHSVHQHSARSQNGDERDVLEIAFEDDEAAFPQVRE